MQRFRVSETGNLTEMILVATKAETKIIAGVADLTQKRKKDVNLSFNISIVRSVLSSEIASKGPGNSCRCSDPKGFSFLSQRFTHFPSLPELPKNAQPNFIPQPKVWATQYFFAATLVLLLFIELTLLLSLANKMFQ